MRITFPFLLCFSVEENVMLITDLSQEDLGVIFITETLHMRMHGLVLPFVEEKYLPVSSSTLLLSRWYKKKNIFLVSLASALWILHCFCFRNYKQNVCPCAKQIKKHHFSKPPPKWHMKYTGSIDRKWKLCTQTPLGISWLQETHLLSFLLWRLLLLPSAHATVKRRQRSVRIK